MNLEYRHVGRSPDHTRGGERGAGMLNKGLHFIAIKVVSLNTLQAVARVAI